MNCGSLFDYSLVTPSRGSLIEATQMLIKKKSAAFFSLKRLCDPAVVVMMGIDVTLLSDQPEKHSDPRASWQLHPPYPEGLPF